jgi:hypothetical protein
MLFSNKEQKAYNYIPLILFKSGVLSATPYNLANIASLATPINY